MGKRQEGAGSRCFLEKNFWLQKWLGLLGGGVGHSTRAGRAALCVLGCISQLEWESSVNFPPGPAAETSREPLSW